MKNKLLTYYKEINKKLKQKSEKKLKIKMKNRGKHHEGNKRIKNEEDNKRKPEIKQGIE